MERSPDDASGSLRMVYQAVRIPVVATGVVLLRETHRIRVVRLGVVAHPESTRLELRFGLCFGETVVITAVCHVVAGFQGLRAPAS